MRIPRNLNGVNNGQLIGSKHRCSMDVMGDVTGAVSGILDLPEGQEVVVIGTVYKEMKLKVSPEALYPVPGHGVHSTHMPGV